MFFGGGMIPTYVLMTKLGVVNNRIGFMIMTGGASLYNMVLTRTFFQNTIPKELFEASKMDGINDYQYLFKIALPLSKANLSVISLYALVAHWNSYMTPLIYLRDAHLHPLPLVVQEIMQSSRLDGSAISAGAEAIKQAANADLMKYALIVVSAVPMIVIYPFVQKFFEKGVMMGSLKG
jgi:ABC-type glycerol-3-phosphate transport system permease component